MNSFFQMAPPSWHRVPLKFLIEGSKNGAWGNEAGTDQVDAVCVRVADFDWQRLRLNLSDPTIRSFGSDQFRRLALQVGDLVLEKSGGGEKTPVGRIVLFSESCSAVTSNFVSRVRPDSSTFPKYLLYLIAAQYMSGFSVQFVKQNTGIQNLDDTALFRSDVWIPDRDTQKNIVDFLDRETARIDQLIEKKQELQSILKIKTQAMLERYFTFGLVADRSRKATGLSWLPTIPASWEITAIKRIVKVKDGTHETPGYVEADEKAFPLITSKDFVDQSIDFSGAKYISAQDHELIYRRSNTQQGDVLMSMIGGNIGKSILVTDDREFSIKNVALFKTTGNHRLARQVLLFLRSPLFTEQLRLLGRGGAQDFIGLGDIRNLMFPVIPSEELDKLVSEASEKFDELKEIHDRIELSVIRLRELRSALITAAVTGQIDLRTWGRNKQTDRHLDRIEEDMTPREARA